MSKSKSLQAVDLKISNRITILNLLRKKVCSRAEIASVLGMSRPAVSSIISELIEENLIHEVGRGDSSLSGGKRPILLDVNGEAALNIAVYFNAEWFEVAIMDLSSNIVLHTKKKANINDDYKITFKGIINEIYLLIDQLKKQGKEYPVLACGIVLKGLVNTKTGVMFYSSTLPNWRDIPVSEFFQDKLNVPVFVENDARASTLKELKTQDVTQNSLVCVNIGIGVGTGVVIDNKIYRGAFETAVNFAHTTVLDGGPLCTCGNRGCWESLTSISALLNELEKRNSEYKNLTIDHVVEKFHAGDPFVKRVVLEYSGYWIGVGVSNILRVFNPECVVIQGVFVEFGKELLEKVKKVVFERTTPVLNKTNIYFSELNSKLNVVSASEVILSYFYTKKCHYSIWNRKRLENENEIGKV